jgi:hypothetical protein
MDQQSSLLVAEDAAAVEEFLAEHGGSLEPDPTGAAGTYWVSLHPRSAPGETYFVRVAWSRYPDEPPSVKFAEGVAGSLTVVGAWPVVPGYRPGNFDICAPFTEEGYATHPEWRTQAPWPTTGNPFLWVVDTLQGDLDRNYGGRAA